MLSAIFDTTRDNPRSQGKALLFVGIVGLMALSACRSSPVTPGADLSFPESAPEAIEASTFRASDVVGKWEATVHGRDSCEVFMTRIKWNDGMRATSRGCRSGLAEVWSWTTRGPDILLVDKDGGLAGMLQEAETNRLEGQLADGVKIILSRKGQSRMSAVAPSSTKNKTIRETDVLGDWAIKANGGDCDLFLTLSGSNGGFRASSRGCQQANLREVTAWQLKDQDIVLMSEAGQSLARLSPNGAGFSGRLASGGELAIVR